jgi:hypothetical protein
MSSWRVTLTAGAALSREDAVRLAHSAAAMVQRSGDKTEITIDREAAGLREALGGAFEIVERAAAEAGFDLPLVGAEATPTAVRQRRRGLQAKLDLAGTAEAREILGVSRQRLHELAERPDFPAPKAVLTAGKLWDRADIEEFNRTWDRRPGRPPKDPSG